jgi:GntR family transcriptional regulator, galactonate operon transcriptional repressor
VILYLSQGRYGRREADVTAEGTSSSPAGSALSRRRDVPLRNLQGHVLHEIGRMVVGGEIAPGETLPIEPELAQMFGVSKTVIREAVRGLAAKGLVYVRPRLGTRVLPRDQWHMLDPDVLAWQLDSPHDALLLVEFDQFRRAVEPMAARLAATYSDAADRDVILAALNRMRAALSDRDAYLRADLEFHASLLAATHNRMLSGLRDAVRSALLVRHTALGDAMSAMSHSLPHHERVFDAVAAGDAQEAGAQMSALLDLTERDDERYMANKARGKRGARR